MIPSTGDATGFYLPELVHLYNVVSEHADVYVASTNGGKAPVNPFSIEATKDDTACMDFLKKKANVQETTETIQSFLGRANEFAGIFYVGGHGPMFDLQTNEHSHQLIRKFYKAEKAVAAVCHGLIVLASVKLSDGSYLVADQEVTGLSKAEEDVLQATKLMPVLLEDVLRKNGGKCVKADEVFGTMVVRSGNNGKLVTGQNPPSAGVIGKALIEAI